MIDKTLLLKGLAGVAAVGGAGTTYIFRKELGIVSSSDTAHDLSGLKPEEIAKRKEEKKKEINEKLSKLGIDGTCNLETSNFPNEKNLAFSKECDLDKEKLQKIKFSNKGEADVTVSGLDTGNIKLKISHKKDGVKYTFSDVKNKITISGDTTKPNITLKPSEDREFEEKEEGSKLGKVSKNTKGSSNASTLNAKLKNLGIANKCWFEEEDNDSSVECDLNKEELKKILFSNKGNSDVTVSGLETGNIKLKIEKKNSNQLGYKFSGAPSRITISGDTTKTNISIGPKAEKEFEEKGGKLAKVSKTSAQDVAKIKEANKKLTTINIPAQCRFEEEDKDPSIECDLSKEDDLKKIVFLNKDKSKDLTISGQTAGLKLTINRLSEEEGKNKYQPGVDLEFLFSGYSSEIKIQAGTSFETNDISLKPNIATPLTISDQSKLAKIHDASNIATKLGLSCTKDTSNTSSSTFNCCPETTVNFSNSGGTNIEKMSVDGSKTSTKVLTATENTENYELGIKFTATQDFPSSSSSPKLEKDSCYEAKYVPGANKGWGLFKKTC